MDQYEIAEILRVNKFELAGEILIEEKYFGPSPKFSLFEEYKTGQTPKNFIKLPKSIQRVQLINALCPPQSINYLVDIISSS